MNDVMCCVEIDHITRVYVPYSFRTVVWVFLHPRYVKCCEKGAVRSRFFVLIREESIESLTICRFHYKGSTFCSVIYRPRALVQLGFKSATFHLADLHSPNLANQVAVRVVR